MKKQEKSLIEFYRDYFTDLGKTASISDYHLDFLRSVEHLKGKTVAYFGGRRNLPNHRIIMAFEIARKLAEGKSVMIAYHTTLIEVEYNKTIEVLKTFFNIDVEIIDTTDTTITIKRIKDDSELVGKKFSEPF